MAAPAMELVSPEAARLVWCGAIPLQIHLDGLEIASLPPPPPALVLAPRVGYLPLLVPTVQTHFSSTLPPGNDTVWFEYNGLPLKWYIPTGVLFDLLCAEPERPWNLIVHFRKPPEEVLSLCEGEDAVKWSYMNSLKEAAYIIAGNCKTIMNMSQADQLELWKSVLKGNMDVHSKISSKLKLGPFGEEFLSKLPSAQAPDEPESGPGRRCRIPIRLYVRTVEDVEFVEDVSSLESWESIIYINRPFEFNRGGCYLTMEHAMKVLLPDVFGTEAPSSSGDQRSTNPESSDASSMDVDSTCALKTQEQCSSSLKPSVATPRESVKVRLIRVQGIELDMNIPFLWVANNLKNPECYLHICIYISKAVESVD